MRLYDLSQAFADIMLDIEAVEGVLDETIEARLDAAAERFAEKTDAVAAIVRTFEADAAAFKAEKEAFAEKQKAAEGRARWLKEYLRRCLEVAGQKKVKGELFTVSVQKNPASVAVFAEVDALPPEYVRTKVEKTADKTAIKAALEAGQELAFAALERTERVVIK